MEPTITQPSNEALRQFLQSVEPLAEAAGYDTLRLGVVVHEPSQVALALSVRLERLRPEQPALPLLRAGHLLAAQHLLPLSELRPLVASLETGVLRGAAGALLPLPVHLVQPPNALEWIYDPSYEGTSGTSTLVRATSSNMKLLRTPMRQMDAEIAIQSDYAYSSLTRLIWAYTRLEAGAESWFALAAFWPVTSLSAKQRGARLSVTIEADEGLDLGRIILNVEGAEGDTRLDALSLLWQARPGQARPGSLSCVAHAELQERQHAVNLYLSRVPVVHLKVGVQSQELFEDQVSPQPAQAPAMEITPLQLTALRLDSLRLLRSVELSLEPGFTVIVGLNQSGKSTVLDALQLLAEAARGELAEGLARRGGLGALRSRSSTGAGVQFEAELGSVTGQRLRYRLRLGVLGTHDFTVAQEELAEQVQGVWTPIFTRKGTQAVLASGTPLSITEGRQALLSQLGPLAPPVTRQAQASLAAIAVYPYFRTGAAWADPEAVPMRQPARLEPGVRLERTGGNLAAALYTLKEEHPEDWQDFMDIARLAFPSLKELRLPAVARGRVQLTWVDTSLASFDAAELSDGTLSFLAMLCALFQPGSALIAIEEPEQHLHPDALMRLVGAARSLCVRQPIVFTTQSDTLMGLLDDIPESVVVARREDGEARLVRPGVEDLREWLKGFSLRDMRRELEGWGTEP